MKRKNGPINFSKEIGESLVELTMGARNTAKY
jgi:hypothetical protein